MKKIVYLFAMILFISCEPKEENISPLIGEWKLVEQLADPGDGSGVFESIDSEKTITFFEGGSVKSNGDLCYMGSIVDYKGTDAEWDDDKKMILKLSCGNEEVTSISYSLKDSDLILRFFCIEACAQKYEKVK